MIEKEIKHLASICKSRRDKIALAEVIAHINLLSNHEQFAKLYLYLFENGLNAYGSTKETHDRIKRILAHDLVTLHDNIHSAYEDVFRARKFTENMIEMDHTERESLKNIEMMSENDKKQIINPPIDKNVLNSRLKDLINDCL
jgi:hypothetical protein